MTKTKVTSLIQMVFLFWLMVSIALLVATIATFQRLPDGRPEHKTSAGSPVDIDFDSFDNADAVLGPTLNLKDLQRPQVGTRVAFL